MLLVRGGAPHVYVSGWSLFLYLDLVWFGLLHLLAELSCRPLHHRTRHSQLEPCLRVMLRDAILASRLLQSESDSWGRLLSEPGKTHSIILGLILN